jgi:hypothetical protein
METPDEPDYDDDCCQTCHGEGGYHDCGEDTCCCADNEGGEDDESWFVCDDCDGQG